jgi:hypothetical protein
MIDMSTWPRRRFDVTKDLRLDSRNVRLVLPVQAPQADIIQDLFQNENAFEMAEAIVSVGFLTHELPIVLKEDGNWTVVEGNRRTAAIKALLNPYLVPGYQARINRLLEGGFDISDIKEIDAIIAPNRDSANQLIAALHTSNPRKPWAPLRQADFFNAQVTGGKKVENLRREYPTIDVPHFIEMAEMHKVLKTVTYEDTDLASYVNRKNFPISVYDRLYTNPEFLDLAKLSVDKETGHVTKLGNETDFAKLAAKVVSDIKTNRINTRTLNKPDAETYKTYMEELKPLAVKSVKGSKGINVSETPSPPPPPPRKQTQLDVSGLKGIPEYPAVGRILDELGRIRYREFPNATFDVIRTFMEKSIKARAAKKGVAIPPKRPGQFIALDDALTWLESEVTDPKDRSLKQVISRLRDKRTFTQTKEFLDAANHNHQIFVMPDEVQDLWDSTKGLHIFILDV